MSPVLWPGLEQESLVSNRAIELSGMMVPPNFAFYGQLTVCPSHCLGLVFGGAKHGGFQHYTTCREVVVAKIPDNIPLSHAVVLPLGLSTSITALFEYLKLDLPSGDAEKKQKTVVIWGGSSSMGTTAIQLAVAAGYDVVSTASVRNHEYVVALGAQDVFDHADPDVVEKISKKLEGRTVAGVCDCIGEESSSRACATILSKFGGGVLPTVLWPPSGLPANVEAKTGEYLPSKSAHDRHHC